MMNTDLLSSILQLSDKLISSESFLIKHRIGNAFSRSGKLSFPKLIYYILRSSHKSISINYSDLLDDLSSEGLPFVSKQAVSKARQGISYHAFLDLFRLSVAWFYEHSSDLNTWNGSHIFAVDGTTVQIPGSKENYEVFGGNPNKTGIVSPLASVSALYDILNDILADVSFHPYRYNERAAAKEHMDFLPELPDSILLFDRGYPSEDMFRFLNAHGILFLMRIPQTFKKAISKEEDILFEYPASDDAGSLALRSLHFLLEDGTVEYLVTNITPNQMEADKFPALYRLRWGIESKYRELKSRLEIESFNSIKPVSILQEFFAAMYLSNLAAIVKHRSDSLIVSHKGNKHSYRSNRTYILNRIKRSIVLLLRSSLRVRHEALLRIIEKSARILSIIRP